MVFRSDWSDMKRLLIVVLLLGLAGIGVWLNRAELIKQPIKITEQQYNVSNQDGLSSSAVGTNSASLTNDNPNTPTIIASNLDTPWGIAVLPDGNLLVTERPGRVKLITTEGASVSIQLVQISQTEEIGEGGLLGIALDPNFLTNNQVYLYYTYRENSDVFNRVSKFLLADNALTNEQIVVDTIPGSNNHNGGRIKFGPDNYLYIGTGDAGQADLAQDTDSLAGKILRVTSSGEPAPGNVLNNRVYSYGHRNVQGLAWDEQGKLWATEHGRSGIQSGFDELNLIENGNNYGWPSIQGDEQTEQMLAPKLHSGSNTTWAPSGLAFLDGSVFFGGLRGQTLYQVKLDDLSLSNHFQREFGRIREVVVSPNNSLYISTSNQDGRGNPDEEDDKIIKVIF